MTTVVERSVDIHATADDVWRILADDFADAAAWNSLMKCSVANPHADVPTGATVGGWSVAEMGPGAANGDDDGSIRRTRPGAPPVPVLGTHSRTVR